MISSRPRCSAARVIAGAVEREAGSMTIRRGSILRAAACCLTLFSQRWPQTITGGAILSQRSRASCSNVWREAIFRNVLGVSTLMKGCNAPSSSLSTRTGVIFRNIAGTSIMGAFFPFILRLYKSDGANHSCKFIFYRQSRRSFA